MKKLLLASVLAIASTTAHAVELLSDDEPIAIEQCNGCAKNGKLDNACVRELDYHGGEDKPRTIITIKQCRARIASYQTAIGRLSSAEPDVVTPR
jgi:hypothetical protein